MTFEKQTITRPRSEQFRVFCGEKELPVYVGADFDFVNVVSYGDEAITVTTRDVVEQVDIRPLRRRKAYEVKDAHSVAFTLARGDYLSFELNGNLERPLLVFSDTPKQQGVYDGANVIAFTEPGIYHVGRIELEDHSVVYIGEGVILRGSIWADSKTDIRVFGNGYLTCDYPEDRGTNPIRFNACKNVDVCGITIVGKNQWNFILRTCRDVVVEDVKILADEVWSDGIDIVGADNVLIRHVFVKNEDDCVCIKSSTARKSGFRGFNVHNVLIEDCVFWSGPRGNSMEIGYETNNSVVDKVTFRNVDVIHRETQDRKFNRCIISIHNSGNAEIRDILYENIYAESTDENFVQISHMCEPDWGEGRGSMENITIRNLTLAGGEVRPSKVSAYACGDPEPRITRNIVFENLVIHGIHIDSCEKARQFGFELDEDNTEVRFL